MTVQDFYGRACEHLNFTGWRITNGIIYLEDTDGSVTEKQIKDKAQELFQEWQNLQYQRDRQPEYPAIGDQLDMLFHAIDAGKVDKTSDFYKSLKAVKDKYPKG